MMMSAFSRWVFAAVTIQTLVSPFILHHSTYNPAENPWSWDLPPARFTERCDFVPPSQLDAVIIMKMMLWLVPALRRFLFIWYIASLTRHEYSTVGVTSSSAVSDCPPACPTPLPLCPLFVIASGLMLLAHTGKKCCAAKREHSRRSNHKLHGKDQTQTRDSHVKTTPENVLGLERCVGFSLKDDDESDPSIKRNEVSKQELKEIQTQNPSYQMNLEQNRSRSEPVDHMTTRKQKHAPMPSQQPRSEVVSPPGQLALEQIKQTDDVKNKGTERDAVNDMRSAHCKTNDKNSHLSNHVPDCYFKNFADETSTESGRISPGYFQKCLSLAKAFVFQNTTHSQYTRLLDDTEHIKKGRNDVSTFGKKVAFSTPVHFSPEVQGKVYTGATVKSDHQRRFWEERFRLASFRLLVNPPAGVWVTRLAAAGFYCPDDFNINPLLRCAYCDVSVEINRFVRRNPLELHGDACLFVRGEATNTSLAQLGQIAGRRFIQALPDATGKEIRDPTSSRPGDGHGCERKELSNNRHGNHSASQSSANRENTGLSSPEQSLSSLHQVAHRDSAQNDGARPTLQQPGSHQVAVSTQPPHTEESARSQTLKPTRPPETAGSEAPAPTLPAQPSEPSRTHIAESGLPYQTARPVSAHQQNANLSSRSSGSARHAGAQGQSRNREAAVTPPEPAPQSPSSPTADPPRQVVTYTQLGIYTQEPKRPDFAILSARIGTYEGWPHSTTHTPEEMAEAGFYYVGQADLVRCFYCKGGLKSWAGPLRPWVEHARFYPQCPFIGQVKGQEFVDVVQELKGKQERISDMEVEDELKKTRGWITAGSLQATVGCENDEVGGMQQGALSGAMGGASAAEDGAYDNLETTRLTLTVDELEAENQEITNERICKICQTNDVTILFLPCGHLVSCAQCAPALRTCAICRQRVKGRVRVIEGTELEDARKDNR